MQSKEIPPGKASQGTFKITPTTVGAISGKCIEIILGDPSRCSLIHILPHDSVE